MGFNKRFSVSTIYLGVLISAYVMAFSHNVMAMQHSETAGFSKSITAVSPTPGEFPIVASTVFNSKTGPNPGGLEAVRECGFNLCMETASSEQFNNLLKYMEGTGLKILMQDWSFQMNPSKDGKWKQNMVTFIERYKNNPLVAGWKLCDEPKWNQLKELKERYELIEDTDSTHLIYINWVGEVISSHTGHCKTLGEYVDYIQKMFPLDIWSSDCYPIWIKNGQLLIRYNDFYTDLAAYAQKSAETGKPMWSYCGSMAFTARHHDIPPATEAHLSFEAFSALAYGAQGIVYWTYWQRPSNSYENYTSALVDLDGNKTPAWYAAQSINRQIRALTNVFLGAEMVEVCHTGNIPYKGTRGLIEDFGPLSRLTNGDKGVLASHLRNNGKDYLLIVNHDVQNKQKVRISFKQKVRVTKLDASSSGKVARKNVGRVQNVILSPGGYVLYEWQ